VAIPRVGRRSPVRERQSVTTQGHRTLIVTGWAKLNTRQHGTVLHFGQGGRSLGTNGDPEACDWESGMRCTLGSGGSATLSVTDGCRWRGGDSESLAGLHAAVCTKVRYYGANATSLAVRSHLMPFIRKGMNDERVIMDCLLRNRWPRADRYL